MVTFENGTYYLTTDENVKYVLTCKDLHRFVGDKVEISGALQGPAGQPAGGAGTLLCVKTMDINGGEGLSTGKKWLIAGLIVGAPRQPESHSQPEIVHRQLQVLDNSGDDQGSRAAASFNFNWFPNDARERRKHRC